MSLCSTRIAAMKTQTRSGERQEFSPGQQAVDPTRSTCLGDVTQALHRI